MVPDSDMDSTVKAYLGAAFALKTVHFLRIFITQVSYQLRLWILMGDFEVKTYRIGEHCHIIHGP